MATTQRLSGKVAIVTASTEGIGYAIAEKLGLDGAKVVISSRKQKNVDAAVQKLRSKNINVIGMVCHVAKESDRASMIKKTIDTYGGIDILVSNAAANPYFGLMLNTPETAWDKVFEVNVKATFLLVREVVPYLKQRKGSSIVLVSSIGGYKPSNMLGAYTISKTTMLGMVKALVPELSVMNIRINGLCPGLIQTKFSETLWKNEDIAADTVKHIPLQRIGQPSECAGIVSFLASDDASYMTGENIVVAGGGFSRL